MIASYDKGHQYSLKIGNFWRLSKIFSIHFRYYLQISMAIDAWKRMFEQSENSPFEENATHSSEMNKTLS